MVNDVQVAVKRLTGNATTWLSAAGVFNVDQAAPNWLDQLTGGVVFTPGQPATWERSISAANLQSGASYYVISRAVDEVSNQEGSGNGNQGTVRSSTFTYDVDFPTAVILIPQHLSYLKSGAAGSVSGTATDCP